MTDEDELEIPENFSKVVLGLVIGVVLIGAVVYGTYTFSKKGTGKTVLPAGFPSQTQPSQPLTLATTDCAKTTKADPSNPWPFYIKCQPFTVTPGTKWKAFNETTRGFSFDRCSGND
ncbi:hypothetical protein HY030_01295 [Candidatus Gottesmanbacteria bacterium]|nr:hypothetical protein [Candidatus Gottesmanbacteria bacterium]